MDFPEENVNSMKAASLTRREIFELLGKEVTQISAKEAAVKIEELLLEKFQRRIIISEYDIKHMLSKLLLQLKKRFIESYYSTTKFNKTNADWLVESVNFVKEPETSDDDEENRAGAANARGRPGRQRHFTGISDHERRRRTSELRKTTSTEDLLVALRVKLREDKESDLLKILTDISEDKSAAKVYRKLYEKRVEKPVPLSLEEAKEFLIANKITARQYQAIKSLTKSRNADIFPCYKRVMIHGDSSSESES